MNFEQLESKGKTIIYKESIAEISNNDWEFWGKRITENKDVFVYRKIVTIEEAEHYNLGQSILT